jgi:hypothetical protein
VWRPKVLSLLGRAGFAEAIASKRGIPRIELADPLYPARGQSIRLARHQLVYSSKLDNQ